jgi:hypothetical protein
MAPVFRVFISSDWQAPPSFKVFADPLFWRPYPNSSTRRSTIRERGVGI